MRLVVCDTGPVLHLWEVDALDLLCLPGRVVIPPAVDSELASKIYGWRETRPEWLRVEPLEGDAVRESETWQLSGILHSGEADSLALARSMNSDWYLTDDAAARVLASSLGVEVHGTLGFVMWAAATGKLKRQQTETLLDDLAGSTLWVTLRVLGEAKWALDELFRDDSE